MSCVHEVTHSLSESWLTSSNTANELENGKNMSGCEGRERELCGREEGIDECAALTDDSICQHEYKIEYPILLPTSGPPIDPQNTRKERKEC